MRARRIHICIRVLIISGNRPKSSICSKATAKMYPVELVADLIEPGAPSADIVASLSISMELAFLLQGNKTLVSLVG